jgi:hypothetical protein
VNESPRKSLSKLLPAYSITVSLIGLLLLTTLTFGVQTLETNFAWRKPVIGLTFASICLLGTVAGIRPSKCSRTTHFHKKNQDEASWNKKQGTAEKGALEFEGHHPNCGRFSAHVIQLDGKKYCAGCTGLAIGGTISLLGTLAYFFAEASLKEIALAVFCLGFIGVTLGLLQYNLFRTQGSFVHLFLNVIFVLGAFLLLIGIEEITSNIIVETYFVALVLYWILTRILLSQQEHKKICMDCGLKSCVFIEKEGGLLSQR